MLEQVAAALTASGADASAETAAAMAALASVPGCQLRRWTWLPAVTLVPTVPNWQHVQQTVLGKADLSSAPMNAAMNASSSVGHLVREAGVVAAAVIDGEGEEATLTLSEAGLVACHLLRACFSFEQRCQLLQSLNVLRSVQRTLALRAGEHLARPRPARDTLHGEAAAGRPSGGRAPSAHANDDNILSDDDDDAAAEAADAAAAGLAAATCPPLPPQRQAPVKVPHATRRQLIEGGHEWYSTACDAPLETAKAAAAAAADPTRSVFVRDGSGRRVVHQAALADLAAVTAEVGHIVAHYGNDSAVAAIYGTGRYDNAPNGETNMQSAEAEAEMRKRLAVATALPAALRLVSRCFACEAAYQRAKASVLLHLLHAYEACTEAATAAELAQQMTDMMAARPRLDLAAHDFEESYRVATHALRLQETLLARLLAAQVNAAVDAAAARAAVPTAWDGGRAVLEAAERARRSPAARLSAASGCAAVALALNRELAGMEARTLAAAQQAHEGKGSLSLSPPFVGRLRCLLLTHGLALSETLSALPPVEPSATKEHDDPAHAAAASAAVAASRLGPDAECAPWVASAAVASAAESRAFTGSGKQSSGSGGGGVTLPPLTAEELRSRPSLLPTLSVWENVQRVSNDLVELRAALRRARPRMAWVPWLTLLPRLTTSNVGLDAPSAAKRSLVPATARLQKAEAGLATAKRFVAAVAKDGAASAHTASSLTAARAVLQLLEAEKQALILITTRQRPPALAPPVPPPTVGAIPEEAAVADAARSATSTLTTEAEEACRKLEALMRQDPPPFLSPSQQERARRTRHCCCTRSAASRRRSLMPQSTVSSSPLRRR